MGTKQYTFNLKNRNLKEEKTIEALLFNAAKHRIQKGLSRKGLWDLCKAGLLAISPFVAAGTIDYYHNQPGFTHDLIDYIITNSRYLFESDPATRSNLPRILTEDYQPWLFSAGMITFMFYSLGSWALNSITSNAYSTRNKIMEEVFGVPHTSEESEFEMYHALTGKSKKSWQKAKKEYFKVVSEWARVEDTALLAKNHNLHLHTIDPKEASRQTYIRPTLEDIIKGLNKRKDREHMQMSQDKIAEVSFALPRQPNQPKMYFDGFVYKNILPVQENLDLEEQVKKLSFLGFEVLVKKLSSGEWVIGSIGPQKPKHYSLKPNSFSYAKKIKTEVLKQLYYTKPPEGALKIALIPEGTYPIERGGVSSVAHGMIRGLNSKHFKGKKPYYEIIPFLGFTGPYKTRISYDLLENTHLNPPIMLFGHTKNPSLDIKKDITRSNLFFQRERWGEKRHHRIRELKRAIKDLERAIEECEIDLFYNVADRMQFFSSDEILRSEATLEVLYEIYHQTTDEGKVDFKNFLDYWRDLRQGPVSAIKSEKIKADVYYNLLTGVGGVYAALAKREFGKPLTLTEHGIYYEDRLVDFANSPVPPFIARKWQKALYFYSKITYHAADNITTLCEGNLHKQLRDGAPKSKIEIIPAGITLDGQLLQRDYPGLNDPNSFTVGMLGNVQPVKRVELFISVAKYLKKNYPTINWNFHVMGRDDVDVLDYINRIHNVVEQSPTLQGIFHFSPYLDFREAFGPLDLGVLLSSSEVLPIVIIECMLLGIPVIGVDVGAMRELIYGEGYDQYGAAGIVLDIDTMENQKISVANTIIQFYRRKYKKLTGKDNGILVPNGHNLESLLPRNLEEVGPMRVRDTFSTDVVFPPHANKLTYAVAK